MGLVAYLTAGDPSLAATEQFVLALAEAGADVIELGVPFSDPVADGPVIQRASERALRGGTTLAGVLALVKSMRAQDRSAAGAVQLLQSGVADGAGEIRRTRQRLPGADGVLITDLTPEEAGEYRAAMSARGLDTIFLAAPTSTDERLALIAKATSGFLYLISRTGVTGAKDQLRGRIAGAGAARAARHRTSDCRRLRHFAAGACFRARRVGRRRRGGIGAGGGDRARRDGRSAAAQRWRRASDC